MLNTDKINPIFKYSTNVKRSYIPKKNSLELISPKNYKLNEGIRKFRGFKIKFL